MGQDGGRSWRMVAGAGAAVMVGGIGFLGWRLSSPAPAEAVASEAIAAQGRTPADTGNNASAKLLVVYVSGEVAHPGMYRLPAGARVGDALAAAGGVLPDADPNRLPNVAAKLTDGKQIKVPRRGASGSTTKLDVNTATEAELDLVPGMPSGLAHEIVSFRQQYGSFSSVSDLKTLLGLDAPTLAVIRKYLTVG